jgi:hypothetical protein
VFPDAALLRVRVTSDPGGAADWVYTVIRNRSHTNIDFMFLEGQHLVPEEDTLHLVRGVTASRPNLFFDVAESELPSLLAAWRALSPGDDSWPRFVARYGIRRSNPTFWGSSDFFNVWLRNNQPINAGILDLSRYAND